MVTIVTLKEFADRYFANMKYKYGSDAGTLCNSFSIHNPLIEECEHYYLLSNFTVSHEKLEFTENGIGDYIIMDEEVNFKIKMNKNKTSYRYYNNRNNYNIFMISANVNYYNGFTYYPCLIGKYISHDGINYIYLSNIKHNFNAELWNSELSKYYYLVDPSFQNQKIKEIKEKLTPVEKEDFEYIHNLNNDIKNKKINTLNSSVKKIILSYIANVSENVQFHLQEEIKEIYKSLNNINDDLVLYIHNI